MRYYITQVLGALTRDSFSLFEVVFLIVGLPILLNCMRYGDLPVILASALITLMFALVITINSYVNFKINQRGNKQ